MNRGEGRRVYLDFLKIIAIYLVLFNHTGTSGFALFTVAQGSVFYPFYLFTAIFTKIAVPLFFMISGALLLGKEEPIKDIVTKRFLKYCIVLLAGSVIAYLFQYFVNDSKTLSLLSFVKTLYSGEHTVAYWYLYMYLAYLLMLPVLRCLARAMSSKEYLWMFLMYGMMQFLSIFDSLILRGNGAHNSYFSFFITTSYVFYPLMGYFIDQKLDKRYFSQRNVLILSMISFFAIVICCIMTQYWCSLIGVCEENSCGKFFSTLIFLPSITIFIAAKSWFLRHNRSSKIEKFIITLGGTTFGLYLIEQICRYVTRRVFVFLKPYIHTMPACLIWIAVACCFGMTITYLVKKIPGVRKFI